MDRFRTFTALLIAGGSIAATAVLPIREARWIAPAARIAALTRQPSECLTISRDAALSRSVAIGRAAFRTPMTLGGQAARAGLSCASCHRNGRGNPDFQFPGLSGAPGTADVTSSLMSRTRGDGVFNPKVIPDLAAPVASMKVSRDPADHSLEHFIAGIVVQEFDGLGPSPAVLGGLAAYVRAIDPGSCPQPRDEPVSVAGYLVDAMAAVWAAEGADPRTARLMLASARWSLGKIDERYAVDGLGGSRERIREADRELAAIQQRIDTADPTVAERLGIWRAAVIASRPGIEADERRSLFNPAILSEWSKDG